MFKPVEESNFVRRADRSAFGGSAVVAVDVDDKRIVEFADVRGTPESPADLVVAVRGVGGETPPA